MNQGTAVEGPEMASSSSTDLSLNWLKFYCPEKVSSFVRSRAELEMVQSKVDARLISLQGRPGAVCAVRERIFSELYDEVIREVSDKNPPRLDVGFRCVYASRMITVSNHVDVKVKEMCAWQSWIAL